jgi:hypothetical protein
MSGISLLPLNCAIAEEQEAHRKAGEPLWAEKFPLPVLHNIRNTIGVYDWSSLYQQNPILTESSPELSVGTSERQSPMKRTRIGYSENSRSTLCR